MTIEICNHELLIYLEKTLYDIDVLYKCFYWYSSDYVVDINDYSTKCYLVKLNVDDLNGADSLISRIKKDLIDFKLRDIVTKETKNIRELMIAKAFANYEAEVEDGPNSEISDPVGFDPKNV